MPCQSNESGFNEKQSSLSHTALVHTKCKIEPTMFGQFVGVETVVSKKHRDGWLYLLRSDHTQTYETLEGKLKHLNANISQENLFHVVGPRGDIIVLGGCHPLLQELINSNGEFCAGVDVWRTSTAPLPPRKRVVEPEKEDSPSPTKTDQSQLLIPGFKRLSRQLQVDFSVNVHGSEGKRRREPVRSIYEEAALEANKKKRVRRQQAKKTTQSTDNESSDFDEDEIMKHAELLASLSGQETPDAKVATKPSYQTPSILSALTRAMDIVTRAHTHTIQAKDDAMRAMETTNRALQETVASQTALIAELLARV